MIDPEMTCVLVTPETASAWLAKEADNRPLRPDTVGHYARQMREGQWVLNGESIKFDVDGRLIDGQHRLHAVIEAKTSVSLLVVRGVPSIAFETLDRGRKRSTGDTLALMGIPNANAISAGLKGVWKYQQGLWPRQGMPYPTTREIIELYEQRPRIVYHAQIARRCNTLLAPSLALTCLELFSDRDRHLAIGFFTSLAEGTGLTIDDPVHILRERLIANRAAKTRLLTREVLALVVKAWNAAREKRRVKSLRWQANEPFPEIV